ncbi:MAG: hypothetical protein ACOY37_00665 [Pseudomonadota bacterium]
MATAASSTHGPAAVFQAHGLGRTYGMDEVGLVALRAVDLRLREGAFLLLRGRSGGRKTAPLSVRGGLDVPGVGLRHRAHDFARADDVGSTRHRREHAGFVFRFHDLLPGLPPAGSLR